jgi:hypothetical protein
VFWVLEVVIVSRGGYIHERPAVAVLFLRVCLVRVRCAGSVMDGNRWEEGGYTGL